MEEEAFVSVEKAETENVVVEKGEDWAEEDVDDREAQWPFGDGHLSPKGRVAIHVLNVVGDGWIGMVEKRAIAQHRAL